MTNDAPYKPSELLRNPPPRPPCWIGPALLPQGGKLLLGAETKAGKSFVAMELARALASGSSPFGCADLSIGQQARVLYLDKELGVHTFLDRWRAYDPTSALGDRVTAWSVHKLYLDDAGGVAQVNKLVKENGVNVVIVDPVNRFTTKSVTDNDTVRSFLEGVDELIDANAALGLSVVLLLHANKPHAPTSNWTPDPLDMYRMAGAATWVNVADSIVVLARETPDNQRDVDGSSYWNVRARFICRHGAAPAQQVLQIHPGFTPTVSAYAQAQLHADTTAAAPGSPRRFASR